MATFNPRIFREYDIRGIIGKDLDEGMFEGFGKAFGTLVRSRTGKSSPSVAVGRDNRTTSASYQAAFISGLRSTGCNVFQIGELTTPAVYFSPRVLAVDAVCSITASHNPPEYNGAKFRIGEMPVSGLDLLPLVQSRKFAEGEGTLTKASIDEDYIRAIGESGKLPRPLKVVLDCGNGTAGALAVASLRAIGCTVVPLYCDSDPTYPHHQPNPVKPENYPGLIAAVKKERANIGFMLDGDGDRVAATDENGSILWADSLLLLFSRQYIAAHPKGKVVVEVKCSQAVLDDVQHHGGTALLCRTGYPNVEKLMNDEGSGLGGEMSGHFYFFEGKEKWFSDAIYAAAKFARIAAASGTPVSELLSDSPKYVSSPEYRLRVLGDESNKERIVETLTREFKKHYKVIDIDGARVLFDDGWGLVRYSKNEPELSLRFESRTQAGLDRIRDLFKSKLAGQPVEATF